MLYRNIASLKRTIHHWKLYSNYFWLVARPKNTFQLVNVNSFNTIACRSEYLKNSFIPNFVNAQNKLNLKIHRFTPYNLFHNTLLKIITSAQRNTFNNNDSVKIEELTRLPIGFSRLREHRFRHNFKDILNLLCPCIIKTETIAHFFCISFCIIQTGLLV